METFEFTRLRMKSGRRQLALRIAIVAFATTCCAAVGFVVDTQRFFDVLPIGLFAVSGFLGSMMLTEPMIESKR